MHAKQSLSLPDLLYLIEHFFIAPARILEEGIGKATLEMASQKLPFGED